MTTRVSQMPNKAITDLDYWGKVLDELSPLEPLPTSGNTAMNESLSETQMKDRALVRRSKALLLAGHVLAKLRDKRQGISAPIGYELFALFAAGLLVGLALS